MVRNVPEDPDFSLLHPLSYSFCSYAALESPEGFGDWMLENVGLVGSVKHVSV